MTTENTTFLNIPDTVERDTEFDYNNAGRWVGRASLCDEDGEPSGLLTVYFDKAGDVEEYNVDGYGYLEQVEDLTEDLSRLVIEAAGADAEDAALWETGR